MVTIRPYRDEDESALIALIRELQAHEEALYDLMRPAADMGAAYVAQLKAMCAQDGGAILLAEDERGPADYAAFTTASRYDDSLDEIEYLYAYVADIAVTARARGKGIGRKLLEACEAMAREAGRGEFRIDVLAKNVRAREVYRDFGFADHLVTMRKVLA